MGEQKLIKNTQKFNEQKFYLKIKQKICPICQVLQIKKTEAQTDFIWLDYLDGFDND